MTLPSLAYTWEYDVNQSVPTQVDLEAQAGLLLYSIKKSLNSGLNPFIVRGSSDSFTAGMDGIDRWITAPNVVWPYKKNEFSWIVLETLGTYKYQILLSCEDKGDTNGRLRVGISPSCSFTGGTTLGAPSAPDNFTLLNGTWYSEALTNHVLHVWKELNGHGFRVAIWRESTNLCSFWIFDKLLNPVSGFTQPNLYSILASTSGICNPYSSLYDFSTYNKMSYQSSDIMRLAFTGEGMGLSVPPTASTETGIIAASTLCLNANDLSSDWPMFSMGLASMDAGKRGRHATAPDLWWRPSGISQFATLIPATGSPQFVVMGDLILPWNGSVPLIA